MPLSVARRKDTGTLWIVGSVRPAGAKRGVRVRRRAGSDDIAVAREEAAALEAEILRSAWHGERRAARTWEDAALSYLTFAPRSDATKAFIRRLTLHFRGRRLDAIDQAALDEARRAVLRANTSPSTFRRNVVSPVRAVLIHAAKRGWCDAPRFDLPPEPKGRTRFLMPAEADALLIAAPPHMRPLLVFLLCTGCRASEALGLAWDQVDLQAARVLLWEGETKSQRRRVVLLPAAAVAALAALPHREGVVFRSGRWDEAWANAASLRKGWAIACRGARLTGITPHALRHTWASWHYALHRDLLLLRQDGGWRSSALVERYAHIMPEGYEGAIRRIWGMTGADTHLTRHRRRPAAND